MNIKVVAKNGASKKDQGALLENFAALFMRSKNYEVTENIHNTGVELDILAVNKANKAKSIYIECKAYDYTKTIGAEVIWKMIGIQSQKKYGEAWLMTTAPLGKQAKAVVLDISNQSDAGTYTFYTPDKLIQTFVDANMIDDYVLSKREISKLVDDNTKLGETLLLITPYGNYWASIYMSSGEPSGVIYTNAQNSDIIFDESLLEKLQDLSIGFDECNSKVILEILQSTKEEMELVVISKLRLDSSYLMQILDLGVKINHPHTNDFTLEDIYIFPDLQIIDDTKRKKLPGQSLLGDTSRAKYIIFGEELSGKSTLGRLLQWKKSNRGEVTILLNGEDLQTTSPTALDARIEDAFRRQYGSTQAIIKTFSEIKKDKSNINIIIDNFELSSLKKPANRTTLLNKLEDDYGDVYLLMNSNYEIEVMARSDTSEQLSSYVNTRILQLGHLKRDELVTKWLQSGGTEAFSENEILGIKSETLKRIEITVGEKFIPTYPFHLLIMLHVFEAGTKARTQGSSYADLYYHFILQALLDAQVKSDDINFYLSYLSYYANVLYLKTMHSINDEQMRLLYAQFAIEMDIDKEYDAVHKLILRAKILKYSDTDGYTFSMTYSRFYFIARYLSSNIDKPDIQLVIKDLIQNLHQTEAANIVVFLVHHSKDKTIIRGIIGRAKALFDGVDEQTLAKTELQRVNNLISEEMKFILREGNPEENRKRELERRDGFEEQKDVEGDKDSVLDIFAQLNLTFKTIDVLGQVITNHYGEINSESKTEILNELYSLGLRGLNGFMQGFDEYVESLTQYLTENHNKDGNKKGDQLAQAINQTIYLFMQVVSLAFLKRIGDSVASKNVLGSVDRVIGSKEDTAAQLVILAAKLNFPNELSKQRITIERLHKNLVKNYLPSDLLKVIVLQHMDKFTVPYNDKQSICATLGIDYSSLKKDNLL